MVNLNDFFNPVVKAEVDENVTEFKPNPKKGKAGVYTAVIRFLPNPDDPVNKTIIKKNVAYLTNPLTQQSQYVDCPSSVGKQDPIIDTFFALRNSGDAIKVENSKQFSRKQKYASLIQVLSCDDEPNLVNKILVWSYGFKVFQKINNELNPLIGTPKNPFDMIHGRPFAVKVIMQNGFANYDQSQFVDVSGDTGKFKINFKDKWIPVTEQLISSEKGQQLVFNYLKENAPDTSQYEYHDWDENTEKFVNMCIQFYMNGSGLNNTQASVALNTGIVPNINEGIQHQNIQPSIQISNEVPNNILNNNQRGNNLDNSEIDGLDDILNANISQQPVTEQHKGSEDSEDNLNLDDVLSGII